MHLMNHPQLAPWWIHIISRTKSSEIHTYLAVYFDHSLAMAGVDFVPAECAQTDPKIKKFHN